MSKLIFEKHNKIIRANITDSITKYTEYTFNLSMNKYETILNYINSKNIIVASTNILKPDGLIIIIIQNDTKLLSISEYDIYRQIKVGYYISYDDIEFIKEYFNNEQLYI